MVRAYQLASIECVREFPDALSGLLRVGIANNDIRTNVWVGMTIPLAICITALQAPGARQLAQMGR